MKKILFSALLASISILSNAQVCSITLTGTVESSDHNGLAQTTIMLKELRKSVIAGADGDFKFNNLCAGIYTLIITHVDYDTLQTTFTLDSNTVENFTLQHHIVSLKSVIITGAPEKKDQLTTLSNTDIKGEELFQTRGATLGESLKSVTGINSLQTGPSLSKPVIHGLHSNRVLILNNGIRQEGQQWGSEHAPEIDPFVASKITIIKGAASVRYGSDAIVGVILLEPATLSPEKKLEGEINLVAATNGRMGVASGSLQGKALEGLNWRAQGTLKRAGNFKTPNYYLKNSGLFEGDYSLSANYKNKNYGVELYYSEFFNKVGIFDGSHVGNANDLDSAFARKIPLTPSYFSYKIDRTYQDVKHNLFKADAHYDFKNHGKIEAVYSVQRNKRDEYDIDVPYSNNPDVLNAPQISFKITTTALDLVYLAPLKNNFSGSIGISGSTQANVFKGIRYLVPNFRNYGGGLFAIEKYTKNKLTLEAGARYDYRWLRVYQLNNTSLQTFNTTTNYSNLTATIGATYKFSDKFSLNANAGSAWRAPSVNELYINGIHLSAASFEKGDSTLSSERSYNFTVSANYESEKFSAELVGYDNIINNYIYAKPTLQPITLISGTYPYFVYTQANVNLKGIDLDVTYTPVKHISLESKTSIVRAWNKTIDDYLIFIPSDRFDNTLKYSIDTWKKFNDAYISIQTISVSKQTRVPPNSDYVDPPAGYSLFNANAGLATKLGRCPLTIDFGVNNFTNVAYRDYLNRFRYYADDIGISFILRTNLNF